MQISCFNLLYLICKKFRLQGCNTLEIWLYFNSNNGLMLLQSPNSRTQASLRFLLFRKSLRYRPSTLVMVYMHIVVYYFTCAFINEFLSKNGVAVLHYQTPIIESSNFYREAKICIVLFPGVFTSQFKSNVLMNTSKASGRLTWTRPILL